MFVQTFRSVHVLGIDIFKNAIKNKTNKQKDLLVALDRKLGDPQRYYN